jgi:tetratricopeptide (TPR) repeat protein
LKESSVATSGGAARKSACATPKQSYFMTDTNSMEPDLERQIDLYARGELSPVEARELAQEALRRPGLFEELNAVALAKAAIESERNSGILERYLSGRLSPLEERELAREALNNEHLFDALAAHGAIEEGLEDPAFRGALSKAGRPVQAIRPQSKVRVFAIAGSIAAAVAFFTVYLRSPASKPGGTAATATATQSTLKPTLDPTANAGQPILLSIQLRPTPGDGIFFRGAETESRPPRQAGSILSIEEKLPTVDLGSIDGLFKGCELRVFRDGHAIGRISVTTVFRDRARGRIVQGATLREGDQVRTDQSVYVWAVLWEIDALTARRQSKKAIDVAQKALDQLGANRELLERMAVLEYQAGALDAARQHYEAAAPQEAAALNSLASLYLLRGDYQRADALLSGKFDGESLNNLGVAAELRGDFKKAAYYYGEALRVFGGHGGEVGRSVQANLTRVKDLK